MLSDARIRLEGRLEAFEHALAQLRHALVRAEHGEFTALEPALDGFDVAPIARLANREVELRALLRHKAALERRGEELVFARARTLRLPPAALRPTLHALLAEPVLYEGAARSPWLPWGLGALIAFIALEVVLMRHPAPLFIHGGVVAFMCAAHLRAPALRVTSRRLFIGEQTFALENVRLVSIHRVFSRSSTPHQLTLVLREGPPVVLKLAHVPGDFCFMLRERGLSVTRTGWWTS